MRNSPLNAIDPTGMTCLYDDNGNIDGDNGDGLGCGSGGSVTVPGGSPDPVPVDPCFYCGYIPGNPPGGSGQQPPPSPPQKPGPVVIGPGYPSYTHFGQSFTYDGVNRLSTATETPETDRPGVRFEAKKSKPYSGTRFLRTA